MASSPLKLRGIRRPHEPKPFEPALNHLYLLRGHAGDGTDCMPPRPIAHAASDRQGRGTIPIKGSRPTSQLHRSTISASPLHRVVLWTQSLGRRGYAVRSGLICELDAHDHDVGSRIALHEGIWAFTADYLMGIGMTVLQHPKKRQCIVVELPA